MNSNVSDLLNRGMELGREGRWVEACDLLRRVVTDDASTFEAWLWLGAMADEPRDAVSYLEKALVLNPRSIRAQKGLEWARERLAKAEAPADAIPEAHASSSALAAETVDPARGLGTPVETADGPSQVPSLGVVQSDMDASQIPPTISDADYMDRAGAAAASPGEEDAFPASELVWKEEDTFSDEGLSPVSLADDDRPPGEPSAPGGHPAGSAAPEIMNPGLIELPRAILSAFQSGEETEPEENPFTISSLDDFAGNLTFGDREISGVPGPLAGSPRNLIDEPGEYSPKSPLFDEIASQFSGDSFGVPSEQPSPATEPAGTWTKDANVDAADPALPQKDPPGALGSPESWDAIIARLRAMDDELQPASEDSTTGDDLTASQSADLALSSDLFSSPSSPPAAAGEEEASTEWNDDDGAEPMVADLPAPPVDPVLDQNNSALVEKGKTDLEAGRLAEAIQSFKQALQIDPNDIEANEQLGIAQYQAGDTDAALAAFQTVVGLKPDQAEGHANLGFLFAERGEVDSAIAAFNQSVRCDSELIEAHLGLADLYKGRGDIDGAIAEWSQAVRLRPDLTDVMANLAETYAERGQTGDAIREYRLLVERKPDDARIRLRLGQLLATGGSTADAIRQYGEALRIAPSLPEAHYGMATCLEQQGNWEGAVAELEKALAIKPDYLVADEKLARLRAAMAPSHVEIRQEEVQEDPEKKSRWGFFRRDKK